MIGLHPSYQDLSRMVDGMLDPAAQSRTKRHVDRCSACLQKLLAFSRVKAMLKSLPPVPIEETTPISPAPLLVPVIARARFSWPVFMAGWLAGMAVIIFITLRPNPSVLKVVSGTPMGAITSTGALGSEVSSDATIQTLSQGHVDLEIPGQVLVRLKPGTVMTWQQVNHPFFSPKPHIVVNLMRGDLLARTKETFWGSHLDIRTPTAAAMVKGTAFEMSVDPDQNEETTLKVLAGSVFFSPHLGEIGVDVQGGEKSQIRLQRLPAIPQKLSADERTALLETYRIGPDPLLALVVGGGPERAEELLQPAFVYMSDRGNEELHPMLRKAIMELNEAILHEDLANHTAALNTLELALGFVQADEVALPLRLLAGACAFHLRDYPRAQAHFRWAMDRSPRHPLASLALAASALTAERGGQVLVAQDLFKTILSRYPRTPEAQMARKRLKQFPYAPVKSIPTGSAS